MKAERWSFASQLFDDIERRHLSASAAHRDSGGHTADTEGKSMVGHRDSVSQEDSDSNGDRAGAGAGADTGGQVGEGAGGGANSSQGPAAAPGEERLPRSYDRGPREMRKTAIDAMAPTALTYLLALQVNRT